MRRIINYIVFALLIIPLTVFSQAEPETKAEIIKVCNTDTALVSINVTNYNNIGAISLVLIYNPQNLVFDKALNINSEVSGLLVNAAGNKIYIAWSCTGNPLKAANINNDKLLDLKFKYLSGANDLEWDTETAGNCEIQDINNNTLAGSFINGAVNPGKYSISGYLNYDNKENSALSDVKLILYNAQNLKIDSTLTGKDGKYIFNNLSNGKYSIIAITDKTPGGITPIDALFVNRFYLKIIKPKDDLVRRTADVDKNGNITPIDALFITRYYLKVLKSFKAGTWLFEPVNFEINCNDIIRDFKGICVGDVDTSFKPQ